MALALIPGLCCGDVVADVCVCSWGDMSNNGVGEFDNSKSISVDKSMPFSADTDEMCSKI